eukprot:TRINITY_DN15882_c1_g1_i2.p1 TRINITY_DN15882_c1_g1~~TRINITY_DN15882_c1_g1_i2.p1  ORF type:complete len:253 (+),score=54.80 TRINITY_DN15882_c1_g1_i2:137-895(+)
MVRCARKIDCELWHTLFQYSEGPLYFFKQSLDRGDLQTASCYLKVILELEGENQGRNATLQILEMCLEVNDLELLNDLLRFLELTAQNDQDPQGILFHEHATKLLKQRNYYEFAKFSTMVGRPLHQSFKYAVVLTNQELPHVLNLLLHQFHIPFPNLELEFSENESNPEFCDGYNLLRIMNEMAVNCSCDQWILITACLLYKMDRLVSLLSEREDLLPTLQFLLINHPRVLAQIVTSLKDRNGSVQGIPFGP